MKPERNDMIKASMVSTGKKFWLRAIAVYAAAEALFIIITYFITYSKCEVCVLPIPFYMCQWLANLLLTTLLWYVLNYIHRFSVWKVIAGNIFIFLLYYFSYNGMLYAVFNSKINWLIGSGFKPRNFESVIYGSWSDIGKYVLKLTAFYMLRFYYEYRNAAHQRLQLAVINKDMQLNLLKQQLSPHFYFNTLNNLYGLARSNNSRLSVALNQLSNIMKYVIVDCNKPKVLLSQEINFLQSYIELERLRYESNTVIELKMEGEVKDQTIVPLLLIQFVENAFKHGMKEKSERSWMKVTLTINDDELIFRVENSYFDMLPSEGIGINSVKDILGIQYESKYDIKMLDEDNQFSVTLKLNLS